MTNVSLYRGAAVDAASTGRSASIWDQCRFNGLNPRLYPGEDGYFYFDDFLDSPGLTSAATHAGLTAFLDTSCTATGLASVPGGAMRLSIANTANNAAGIQTGGTSGVMTVVASGTSAKKMYFEARIRLGQITNTGVFIGLGEEGLAADNTLADGTGATGSKDLIGFLGNANASTCIFDAVYRKAGQSATNPTAASGSGSATSVLTSVASTWYKFGLLYNPSDRESKVLKWLVNGAVVGYVLDTAIDDSTFPDGEELAPLFYVKTIAAEAKTADIEWWAVAGAL